MNLDLSNVAQNDTLIGLLVKDTSYMKNLPFFARELNSNQLFGWHVLLATAPTEQQ